MIAITLVVVIFTAVMTVVIVSLTVQRQIIVRLRANHQDTYREVGEPTDIPGPTSSAMPLDRFISSKKYLALKDGELTALCERRRQLDRILVASLGLVVLGSIAYGVLF